jgi:molecular chaperone GrpE
MNEQKSSQRSANQTDNSIDNSDADQLFESELQTEHQADSSAPDTDSTGDFDRLQAELTEAREQLFRATAEVDNIRKRARRDVAEQSKFATLPLVAELVEVVDNLDRALQSADDNESQSAMVQGVKIVANQLNQLLANTGCQRIETVGKEFDPTLHEAIQIQPNEEYPAQVVIFEARPGYKLHDRVIRAAQVIISGGPPQ